MSEDYTYEWETMQRALHGAANVYEEMAADDDELALRGTTREETLAECGLFRTGELHPAGTRARIAALEAENKRLNELVGALLNWLHEGAGEDSREYQRALVAVGRRLPSLDEFIADIRREADDYTPGGLDPLDTTKTAPANDDLAHVRDMVSACTVQGEG